MSFHLSSKKRDPKTGKKVDWGGPIRLLLAMKQALLNAGALDDGTGAHPPLVEHAMDASKLASMDGQHVTADECAAAAAALKRLLGNDDDVEFLIDCLDLDREDGKELVAEVKRFAAFHARAARLGGYTVS